MKSTIGIFLFMILTLSCSSIRLISDHLDPEAQALYGSYLVQGDCDEKVSQIYEIRVSNAINGFMREKGLSESDNPDMLIKFFVKESPKSYITQECRDYDSWGFGEVCEMRVIDYEEGSIVIDIINTETQNIAWHGVILSPAFDYINNSGEKINKYVSKLMSEYYGE